MSTVIVVGSGIGGLSAAKTLIKAKFKVIVLEANDTIGGRLRSQDVPIAGKNFAFDLGASWIHGSCPKNPVTKLSKDVKKLTMVETEDDSMIIYNSKGEDITEQADKEWEDY